MTQEQIRVIGQRDIDREAVYKTPRFWLTLGANVAAGIIAVTTLSSWIHQAAVVLLMALASAGVHANAIAVPPRRLWPEEMRQELRAAKTADEVEHILAKYGDQP